MSKLVVDYVAGATDPDEELSDAELEIERALEWARLEHTARGQKEFVESLHPRDDHGRWTDGGGGSSGTPTTTTPTDRASLSWLPGQVHDLYVKDFNNFIAERAAHGGPTDAPPADSIYASMNVVAGSPTAPDPDQLARCEEAAAKFLSDPEMQPLFDEYGKPGIAVVTGLVTTGPDAGASPVGPDGSVVAQWSNGTIFMYAQSAGDSTAQSVPGWGVAGADPLLSLEHEYGHQIGEVTGYNASGNPSDFRQSFVEALGGGISFNDHMSPQQQQDFAANAEMNAGQVSQYAESSPDEAFAEFFAELKLQGPNFDIESSYDGGAAEALHLIRDRIKADTGTTI